MPHTAVGFDLVSRQEHKTLKTHSFKHSIITSGARDI